MTIGGVPLIAVSDLSKSYPGPATVDALQPASFSIAAGAYVAITGPSGSGKTTLLSLLATLERPSAGSYFFDGRDVGALDDREVSRLRARRIGIVFQAFHLLAHLDVFQNVKLSMRYQDIPASEQAQRAIDALRHVGLGHRLSAKATSLSGGEKQRVAIARTIAQEPDLVLCDEPTGNLDSTASSDIVDLLERLNADGVTVIVVTHDLQIADRIPRRLQIRDGWVSPITGSEDGHRTPHTARRS